MKLHEIKQLNESEFLTNPVQIKVRLKSQLGVEIKGTYEVVGGFVNVKGSVLVSNLRTSHLPFRFGTVTANFEIRSSQIISLDGCPKIVGGEFKLSELPKLTSLKYGPEQVPNSYYSLDTLKAITSLEGMPLNVKWINICRTSIKTLDEMPLYEEVKQFRLEGNKELISLRNLPIIISGVLSIRDGNDKLTSFCGISDTCKHIGEMDFYCKNFDTGGLGLIEISHARPWRNGAQGPFKIIQKYLGTDDIIECQSELIEAGYEDYAQL